MYMLNAVVNRLWYLFLIMFIAVIDCQGWLVMVWIRVGTPAALQHRKLGSLMEGDEGLEVYTVAICANVRFADPSVVLPMVSMKRSIVPNVFPSEAEGHKFTFTRVHPCATCFCCQTNLISHLRWSKAEVPSLQPIACHRWSKGRVSGAERVRVETCWNRINKIKSWILEEVEGKETSRFLSRGEVSRWCWRTGSLHLQFAKIPRHTYQSSIDTDNWTQQNCTRTDSHS